MMSCTFDYDFGDLIRPFKFPMRKVLETKVQVTLPDTLSPGGHGCLGMRLPLTQAFLAQILSRSLGDLTSGRGRPGFEASTAA